jgi:large repetitive protein
MVTAMMVLSGPAQTQTAQGVDLTVRKSVSPKLVAVGERQNFTIKVTNEGNRRAKNVTMSDPLPGKVRFVKASTSRHDPGSCGLEPVRTVVCDLGTLRAGKTVTVWIIVKTVEAGSYTNRAFVSFGGASALELDGFDNQDTARARVEA